MQIKPDPFPVTQAYMDFARAEVARLEAYRAEVLVRLQDAREKGDLSENGAYTAARAEQRDTDRALRRFRYVVLFGRVQKPTQEVKIEFGHVVTLTKDSSQLVYQLVSNHEANPAKGKISIDSPLGSQCIGKRVGDEVRLKTPTNTQVYRVEHIKIS